MYLCTVLIFTKAKIKFINKKRYKPEIIDFRLDLLYPV